MVESSTRHAIEIQTGEWCRWYMSIDVVSITLDNIEAEHVGHQTHDVEPMERTHFLPTSNVGPSYQSSTRSQQPEQRERLQQKAIKETPKHLEHFESCRSESTTLLHRLTSRESNLT